MGNGKCFTYFIGVDLWLIFIFQGWEMGNVLESVFSYYSRPKNESHQLRLYHRTYVRN